MVPQWWQIPQTCRGSKYVSNKKLKRSLKRARGGLVVDEVVLPYMNQMLQCAGFDIYVNPGDPDPAPPPDQNPLEIAGLTITRAGFPANSGTLTMSGGPATSGGQVIYRVVAEPAGDPIDTTVTFAFSQASTAEDLAQLTKDALDVIDNMIITVDGAVVTVGLQAAGTITNVYMDGIAQVGGGTPPGVYGPYSLGQTRFWVQKEEDEECWVWFDVDGDPQPDVRQKVCDFLADENNDVLLRAAVQNRANALNCKECE